MQTRVQDDEIDAAPVVGAREHDRVTDLAAGPAVGGANHLGRWFITHCDIDERSGFLNLGDCALELVVLVIGPRDTSVRRVFSRSIRGPTAFAEPKKQGPRSFPHRPACCYG